MRLPSRETFMILFATNVILFAHSVSAQTAAAANYGSFAVGGSNQTFYAVQFTNNITPYGAVVGANTSDLVIYRDDTHQDGLWFGTFNLVISFHPMDWGHFPAGIEKVIYQTGSGSPYNDPVGDIADGSSASSGNDLIVWLRGGATYEWRNKETTAGWSLTNGNSAGASIVDSSGTTMSPITAQSQLISVSKNSFYINAIGLATGHNLYVGGNVGIGTLTPSAPLEVTGTIKMDSGVLQFPDGSTLSSATPLNQLGLSGGGTPVISQASGNVGIGVATPTQKLEVDGNAQIDGAALAPSFSYDGETFTDSGNTGYDYGMTWHDYSGGTIGPTTMIAGYGGINLYSENVRRMTVTAAGNIGIGTTTPLALLDVNGAVKISGSGAGLTFPDGSVQSTAYTGTCPSTGGDYAESVDVDGDKKDYEPGDVMVIDPDHPGHFLMSSEPYSSLVAGIYSTKPGYVGRRQTTDPKLSTTEIPMAMVGIVPTKATTENGPIKVGDLLVTSSIPGYVMKGTDHDKMPGTIVGKALASLKSDTGVIEVLVSLQ